MTAEERLPPPLAETPRDSVDALLEDWRTSRDDLDFAPVGVIARLGRVRAQIEHQLDEVFAAHGLSAATFGVLVTLARIDPGGGVTQRTLMDELGLTSGTVSVRMQRLVDEGLVDRRPDPASARNTLISLTPRGRELFERVAPAHLANERRLLGALSDEEHRLLAALLRKLLVDFEGSTSADEPPLGLTLAPHHVTAALRGSVGLPAVSGLLVRAVAQGSAADAAGMRAGDVLVAANGSATRAIGDLRAALADARPTGRLAVRVVRATDERDLSIDLPPDGGSASARERRPVPAEHQI